MKLKWYEIIQEVRAAGIYMWYDTEGCGWRARFVRDEDPQIFSDIIVRVSKKYEKISK
jgi:hypothetical protein